MYNLDFEKPIVEFEEKIKKFQEATVKEKEALVSRRLRMLNNQLEDLKKDIYSNLTGWQRVQVARHPERPYTLDYINHIATGFIELHGDRNYGDDKAIVGGFGKIDGKTFMFIGHQKGRNTRENQYRNFGMANPEGYRKSLRLMKLAERFNKPIITFVDTPGASSGMASEERGQAEAIQKNIREMVKLKVPVICFITGEGASGGALALSIGDKVLMLENSWYSVISPEACSSILWRNWDFKIQAAEELKLTARDLLQYKLIDGIIPEPLGGAHRNPEETYQVVKKMILSLLTELEKMPEAKRIKKRIDKYLSIGFFTETT
jgi:acetyl-CoA carboxylase carboxyl transferase subunit alpha